MAGRDVVDVGMAGAAQDRVDEPSRVGRGDVGHDKEPFLGHDTLGEPMTVDE
jgi:hypothetical protein